MSKGPFGAVTAQTGLLASSERGAPLGPVSRAAKLRNSGDQKVKAPLGTTCREANFASWCGKGRAEGDDIRDKDVYEADSPVFAVYPPEEVLPSKKAQQDVTSDAEEIAHISVSKQRAHQLAYLDRLTEEDYADIVLGHGCRSTGIYQCQLYLRSDDGKYALLDAESVGAILLHTLEGESLRGFTVSSCPGIAKRIAMSVTQCNRQLQIAKNKVPFRNGILDLRTMELEPWGPMCSDAFFPWILKADYIGAKKSRCPNFHRYLETASDGDDEVYQQMLAFFAFLLVPNVELKQFIVAGSAREAGKSMIMRVFSALVGNEVVSAFTPNELAGKFASGALLGKALNVQMEVPNEPVSDRAFGIIKAISGGDPISVRAMYKNPVFTRLSTKLVFGTNSAILPETPAPEYWSRIWILPYLHTLSDDERDVDLEQKLLSELDEIASWLMITAHKYFVGTPFFPTSARAEAMKADWISRSEAMQRDSPADCALAFVKTFCVPMDGAFASSMTVYEAYKRWCQTQGHIAVDSSIFVPLVTKAHPGVIARKKQIAGDQRSRFIGLAFRDPVTDEVITR